jgi:hypothetical protein
MYAAIFGASEDSCSWFTKGDISMSTIRRHGVAFHLLPSLGDGLWLEVIRESDGAVLVTEQYTGQGDDDFAEAVEAWFDDVVLDRLTDIDISWCRLCGARRREVRQNEDGIAVEHLIEYEYDLCLPCGSHLERTTPWIVQYLKERYRSTPIDDVEG